MIGARARIPERPESEDWDVIVIGTGMGGSTLGWDLARRGRRVLMLEKGRLLHRDAMTDYSPIGVDATRADVEQRLRRGWWPTPLTGETSFGAIEFYAPLGCGTGGSTALYAAALERFHPLDFTPRASFPDAKEASLPDAWPVSYADLVPYYRRAEALFRVHGTPDPLHPAAERNLPEPPPASPRDQELIEAFTEAGLHPYRLHAGRQYAEGCDECPGALCPRDCKADAGWVCVLPAIERHGAALLPECEVLALEAGSKTVDAVRCRWRGREIRLRAPIVVLAAGAYMSPILLLNSRSPDWPDGLANGSGQVGRNLMLHASDFVAVRPPRRRASTGASKSIAMNDLYFAEGRKLGTFQSVGVDLTPWRIRTFLRDQIDRDPSWWKNAGIPFLKPVSHASMAYFNNAALFASIIEDLPYTENRVVPDARAPSGMRFEYRYPDELRERVRLFRERLPKRLAPVRTFVLSSENNLNYGHVCGTCRFGDDPATSVLDRDNRAHQIENLYVVDASFFPSSSGTNPSLTIGANALRVAQHIDERLGGERSAGAPAPLEVYGPSAATREEQRLSGIFNGKTIVVTGAGSGIGRGFAIGFARDGATVIGIGRTESDLAETASQCGGAMHYVVGDVSVAADVERLFAQAEGLTGRVDVLVNNAAVYPKVGVLEGSAEEWIRTFEINVIGMYLCCRRALPGMLERGYGRILNMGSFAYRRPIANSSAYSASKGAVRALTRAIAAEIDRTRYPDVLVNELMAGVFRTRMSDTGEDPSAGYGSARFAASLRAGGPHGETIVHTAIHEEDPPGLRTRVVRKLRRVVRS